MEHSVKVAWLAMTQSCTSPKTHSQCLSAASFHTHCTELPTVWTVLYQCSNCAGTPVVASLLLCGVAARYCLVLARWPISSSWCYLWCYIFGNSWPHLLLCNWKSCGLRELKAEFLTGYSTLALARLLLRQAVDDLRVKKTSTQPSPLERVVPPTMSIPFKKSSRCYEELRRI